MNGSSTILFADDGPDDRFLMQAAWKEAKAEPALVTVEDGDAVLAYLGAEGARRPDLLILDLKMPRMSGIEVLRWVRASPRWRHTPTIILSASNAAVDVAAAYDLCVNAYATKPGTLEELTELVRALLAFGRFIELPRG